MKFICFTDKYNCVPNFTALTTSMHAKFLSPKQEREREYLTSSHKSDINSIKKVFKEFDLDHDSRELCKRSDVEDKDNGFANPDGEYSYYPENIRTGQRYQALRFEIGKLKPN